MKPIDSIPGFYGKLPAVGDFVSRRLSRDFIGTWDHWLQCSLTASRETLGQLWLTRYLNGPLWRFALSPGIAGDFGWIGILMPSVDRVGRYFPLTLALAVPDHIHYPTLFASNNAWYESLESVALTALEDNLDPKDLDDLLKQVNSPALPALNEAHANLLINLDSGKKAIYIESSHAESDEDTMMHLNTELLEALRGEELESMTGQTFWGTLGAEHTKPFILFCQGLPPVHAFSGFLNGELSARGWNLEKNTLIYQQNTVVDSSILRGEPNPDQFEMPAIVEESRHMTGQWQSHSRTDIGKRRKCNEDALLDKPEAGMWVVADGMGGHQAGDVASQMIINTLNSLNLDSDLSESIRQVRQSLKQVNDDLRDLADSRFNHQIVGSTVVVMLGSGRQAAFLWAGDSRLYQLRAGRLRQLTVDHTDDPDDDGNGYGESLKKNNVITRAVGAHDELLLDCETIEIHEGDVYLLSSDGLDKEVRFDEIEKTLTLYNISASVDQLVDLALDRNARDNVSVIIVKVLNVND
ncbi:MAG: type VI secretion system-associated protein TagF [Methylococcaceae bacterium]|nr:type VI secretion system-associated protein TagF [Methylococcaceae bacterium]